MAKVQSTGSYYRVQLKNKHCAKGSYRYKNGKKGTKLLTCCPKGNFKGGKCETKTQSITALYPKSKFTKKQVGKRHGRCCFLPI